MMTNQGWQCPKCQRVNDPWMPNWGFPAYPAQTGNEKFEDDAIHHFYGVELVVIKDE